MRAGRVTCIINKKKRRLIKKNTMYADWLEVFVYIVCKKKISNVLHVRAHMFPPEI